jgi:hypothetical protein
VLATPLLMSPLCIFERSLDLSCCSKQVHYKLGHPSPFFLAGKRGIVKARILLECFWHIFFSDTLRSPSKKLCSAKYSIPVFLGAKKSYVKITV